MKLFSFDPVDVLSYLTAHWKSSIVAFIPILFLPLALSDGKVSIYLFITL